MYHALYRKYRPQDFDTVVGQDIVIRTLRNSIQNQTFSHAYMFFGPRGVGKTTVSKIFARSVNCLNPKDGNSCGKCDNCLHSYEKECVDIIEIDAASNNGVDEIRELKSKISLVPSELKYKVYIIDEVHMLSTGAFNALLKTLEEPPEHAIFILATTEQQKVPETIISRCQCFSFKRISNDMIVSRLETVCREENIDVEKDVLVQISIFSDGGMRDSLGMLDKLSSYTSEKVTVDDFFELNGMINQTLLKEFCDFIFSSRVDLVLKKINQYNSEGKNVIQILSQLMYYLRDLLLNYYINHEEIPYSISKIQDLINQINEKMFDIKKSSNPIIYIEMLLISYINLGNNDKNISREINSSLNNQDSEKNYNKNVVENVQIVPELINIKEESIEEKDSSNNISSSIGQVDDNFSLSEEESNVPININDIMLVRVNNTLATANKKMLAEELENIKKFNDYTFDQKIGYIACALLDSKVRAVGPKNMIISYEYDSIVKQNLINLDSIIDVYHKITGSDKLIAIISDQEWEKEKLKYIEKMKSGEKYTVHDEPDKIFEDSKKSDIITNSAIELFGDIVEIK